MDVKNGRFRRQIPLHVRHFFTFDSISLHFVAAAGSRAYAFGREMVCSQKSVRNRNFFENAGHGLLFFLSNWLSRDAHKTMQNQPTGYVDQAASLYWDHAVSWGGGFWVSVSDIGRVGKKMVLRRIIIYFLSTIFHDLKPKLPSSVMFCRPCCDTSAHGA